MVRSLLISLPIALFFSSLISPVFAWEFSLKSIFQWEYYTYSGLGSKGFFGEFNEDNSDNPPALYGGTRGSAASMNGWLGNQIGQLSSGSDLAVGQMYMIFDPEFRINPALRVRGSYRIGSWATPGAVTSEGQLVRSRYADGLAPGVNRSFSPGYWNTLWVSAQTPWGIVVAGKRPAEFGIALFADATDNSDALGILFMAPFGPFRCVINCAPWSPSPFNSAYFTLSDKNAVRPIDTVAGVIYDAASLSVGIAGRYFRFHVGPESATYQGVDDPIRPTGRYGVIPSNTSFTNGSVYMKYFDGRFFLNGEVVWMVGITRNQKWLASAPGTLDGNRSLFAPSYVEHWRVAAETGICAGPAKVSLLCSWIPGPDRRHGVRIDRQADMRFLTAFSNVTLFRPYSLILCYTYGTGNNSFTEDSANGFVTDAITYGMRIDYALASNLNVFGSFFYADRLSHGYGWGFVRPQYSDTAGRFTGAVQYFESDQFTDPRPSIPDANLGYELNWGFGWKLLEGYTLSGTFGIWNPGKWFHYACIDRSVSNWKNPSTANNFGINANRKIDPVFGMEILMSAEF